MDNDHQGKAIEPTGDQGAPMATDGPWRAMHHTAWRDMPSWEQLSSVCHVGDYVVVTSTPSYEFHGTEEADASLIAAAPEMLEVLRAVADHFADTEAPLGQLARTILAKAEGRD